MLDPRIVIENKTYFLTTAFIDISSYYSQIYILIFGSYHPINKPILDKLAKNLKIEGFKQTFLAMEVIKIPNEIPIEIEKEMQIN